MSTRISDCPPLLAPGEHIRTLTELRDLCVTAFPHSTTRSSIMEGFTKIVYRLRELQVPCELVVDGSYLTEEIEPDDIDFAVVVEPEFYEETATAEQREFLDWIRDDKTIQSTHLSDCYLSVEYREGDKYGVWFEGINDREWWVRLYAKSVVYKRIRGIVVMKIP